MKNQKNQKSGFTLVETMIIVTIIGLLAAILIPNFVKARQISRQRTCIANLKLIEGAKATWEMENHVTNNAVVVSDGDLFGAKVYIRVKPECPAGGVYTLGNFSTRPTCSVHEHKL